MASVHGMSKMDVLLCITQSISSYIIFIIVSVSENMMSSHAHLGRKSGETCTNICYASQYFIYLSTEEQQKKHIERFGSVLSLNKKNTAYTV